MTFWTVWLALGVVLSALFVFMLAAVPSSGTASNGDVVKAIGISFTVSLILCLIGSGVLSVLGF